MDPYGARKYSTKASTVEVAEQSGLMQIVLLASLIFQILIAIGLLIAGGLAAEYCDEADFAGVTPVSGGVFLFLGFVAAAANLTKIRMLAVIMSVINFLFAAIVLVFESMSYRCTREGELKPDTFCTTVRDTLDFCDIIRGGEVLSATIVSRRKIPHDPFNSGRVALVILGVLGLLTTLLTMVLLSAALKMGKPVYLAVKRHKKSIVVGKKQNAELASTNKMKNLDLIVATGQEEARYDKRKTEKYKEYLLWKKYCEPEGPTMHDDEKEKKEKSQKAPSVGSNKSSKKSQKTGVESSTAKSSKSKLTSVTKSAAASKPRFVEKSEKLKTAKSLSSPTESSRNSRGVQLSMQSPAQSLRSENDDKKKNKKKKK